MSGGFIGGPNNGNDDDVELMFEFDKFMDDIVKKETDKQRLVEEKELSPQRKYNKLYRERWVNRTRLTSK